jgi:hypothetical protein
MNDSERANVWKLTAMGFAIAAVTALITGLVVVNRAGAPSRSAMDEPSASATGPVAVAPSTNPARPGTAPPGPGATQPSTASDAKPLATPPREIVTACNQQAAAQAGSAPRQGTDKALDVAKDAGIGALGGAAVGALGGAVADGGSGAGKGALIGGALGAGGGTLYGMWDNKKNDERFRAAYGACMRARGYTG